MTRSRLVFDRQKHFFCWTGCPNAAKPGDGRERPSAIDIFIPLGKNMPLTTKSLTSLARQMLQSQG